MSYLIWAVPAVFAFLSGVFFVNYLTVHPLQMSAFLLATCVTFFLTVTVLGIGFRRRQLLLAALLSIVAFSSGYLLRTNAVLARQDTRFVPQLERTAEDSGAGHTAVVYFTHGEPQTYDPIGWLNQFREFDEQEIPFVPVAVRPVFIYQLRNAYLKVGQSHHREMHMRMLEKLEEAFRADGYTDMKFYLSFLDDEPRPDAAVIQALNDGASEIIVAEVFVSISNHTAEGEQLIREVHAEAFGVPVLFTSPLWDSATLHRMFLDKLNAARGATDRSRVGVILVGHGQPDEWDVEFPTETEHEILFREATLDVLEADGYLRENLTLAWMEFKEPKPAEAVERLLANGVEKIIYFSAAISADSIHSQYDVPELVSEAQVPDGIPLVNLGAWNDHPLAIQAIKERIEAVLVEGNVRGP